MLTPDNAVPTTPAAPDAAPLGTPAIPAAVSVAPPVPSPAAAAAILANHNAQVEAGDFDDEDGTRQLANGNVQVLTSGAYKRIKEAALKKGERAAQVALEERAKAAGFATVDAMFAMLGQLQSNRAGTPAAPPAATRAAHAPEVDDEEEEVPAPTPGKKLTYRDQRKYDLRVQRLEAEAAEAREARLKAERRMRQIEAEAEVSQLDLAYRRTAIRHGAEDVDYVVSLYSRAVQTAGAAFDEEKFFTDLRQQKPFLFGEARAPVNTGTAGGTPPAPGPGVVSREAAQNGRVDARKMSPEEYRAHLAKRGLSLAGGAG